MRVMTCRYFLLSASIAILFAAACGDDEDDIDPEVVALCDDYEALDAACGYDKFADRAHCETSGSACTSEDRGQLQAFYDCLAQCEGSTMTVEEWSETCSAQIFAGSPPDC